MNFLKNLSTVFVVVITFNSTLSLAQAFKDDKSRRLERSWTRIVEKQDRGDFEGPISLATFSPKKDQIRKFVKDNYEWKEEVDGEPTGSEVLIRAEGDQARSDFFAKLKDWATEEQIHSVQNVLKEITIRESYFLSGEGDSWDYLGLAIIDDKHVVSSMWLMHID